MDYENFYYKEALEGAKKKYNEALERAKKLQETCDNPSVVGWCEYIFPQLRESEDEKIRIGLIEFFRDWGKTRSYCWNIYIPDILTWLEKQGEQKPANKPQRIISAEAKEAMYDKPWSEEDENHIIGISQTIFGAVKHNVIGHKTGDMQIDWLRSLKERVQQPKQEWSEEDERNLEGIIDEIEANKAQAPDYDLATYDRFLSWLKSLRPQNRWKPSDEQLEALRIAAEIGTANNSWAMDVLKCVYQYLKKLREE